MRERTVSREVKKALRDSIIVPTVAYASETWVWNQSQRSKDGTSPEGKEKGCIRKGWGHS